MGVGAGTELAALADLRQFWEAVIEEFALLDLIVQGGKAWRVRNFPTIDIVKTDGPGRVATSAQTI